MINDYFPPLKENGYYHIFNRGNNGGPLFFKPDNYFYFLKKFNEYLADYLCCYAYCLLPNHFHLLVYIKNFAEVDLQKQTLVKGASLLTKPEEIVSEQFRRFFLSYAKAIKIQEKRTGSLLEKNFKRKLIETDEYFIAVVNYIHQNPYKHKVADRFQEYLYSSYSQVIASEESTVTKEIMDRFGGRDAFIRYHLVNPVGKSDIPYLEDMEYL